MKRTIFLSLLLAGLIVIPAMAQDAPETQTADFDSTRPQFLSFSIGIPIGYDLYAEEVAAGFHFGLTFAVMDTMQIGFDRFAVRNEDPALDDFYANLFRIGFALGEQFGFGFGFGSATTPGIAGTVPVIGLGAYWNMFQSRAANGLAYGLGLRVDYIAPTEAFAEGVVLFTIRASFGL